MINPESVFEFCIEPHECHAESPGDEPVHRLRGSWSVPADLPYLEGHFPDNPVMPAVGIIDATIVFLRRALGWQGIRIESIKSGKFVALVRPGMKIALEGRESATQDGEWIVDWKSVEHGSERLLASLSLRVLRADDHVLD